MSLKGRSAVNQNSGEQMATAIAHHATASSSANRRNRPNSSGISSVPAMTPGSASAFDSGLWTGSARITAVEALPSAMKTG